MSKAVTPAVVVAPLPPREYWEKRYRQGGTSGVASRGDEVAMKVGAAAAFAKQIGAKRVLDFGCGDGIFGKMLLEHFPCDYEGLDFSPSAVQLASEHFPTREGGVEFLLGTEERWDLVLCFDVLFHVVTKAEHDAMVDGLFRVATRGVQILTWGPVMNGVEVAPHNCYWPVTLPDTAVKTVATPFLNKMFLEAELP